MGRLPASAVPVPAAAPEQQDQQDDQEDGVHGFSLPFPKEEEHETCQSCNRTDQAEKTAHRREPSSAKDRVQRYLRTGSKAYCSMVRTPSSLDGCRTVLYLDVKDLTIFH